MPEPSHRGFRTPCAGRTSDQPAPIVPLTGLDGARPGPRLAPVVPLSLPPRRGVATLVAQMLAYLWGDAVDESSAPAPSAGRARLDHPAGASRPRPVPPPPPGAGFPDDAA
jgi:hypothetical protein